MGEVYRRETDYTVSHPHIDWDVDNGYKENLPIMKTDIVLKDKHKVLVIDTKFYSDSMQSRENKESKNISDNLYQMYTYINNYKLSENEKCIRTVIIR